MAREHAPPDEVPHPRNRLALAGQDAAAVAFADAIAAGRLHHAWLLGGPKGIGKATLAYRVARRLLATPEEVIGDRDGLGVDPAGRTVRQVAAGSHPNLLALEKAEPEAGQASARTIPIEIVRRVLSFFHQTAADGGYRVCIIDSIEDLTIPGANALLKTIEEPPPRALIMIVSHAPQRVLATIRSRCRKLSLPPLDVPVVQTTLRSLGPSFDALPPDLSRKAAVESEGSLARALTLLDPKRLALLEEVSDLLGRLPDLPTARIVALAERLGDKRGEADAALVVDRIVRWLGHRVEEGQARGPGQLAPLVEVCDRIQEAARTGEAYNLDRRPFIVSIFEDLAQAVRRTA